MAVTRGRFTIDDLPKKSVGDEDVGLKRKWFRYKERRVTTRGAARLKVMATRRTARESRKRRRGRDVLDGVVDAASFTIACNAIQ